MAAQLAHKNFTVLKIPYGMARADGPLKINLTAAAEVDGSESFTYDNGAIKLYAFREWQIILQLNSKMLLEQE